ncbi:MAG: autotransporter outer membrane beta-barrel domain-containing protein, partial [Planctomycetaceae bacterium]|jgi:outer membrane autotransporter protein|nr:autotransporter outer membrane beta-barrel domain-containing protein [Planctomycetaceae bacterium]
MNLTSTVQSAEQYSLQNKFAGNKVKIAALLDGYAPAQQKLLSLDTREQLETLIKTLSSPELVAAARELPMTHPYLRVFNHVNNLPQNNSINNFRNVNSGTLICGQAACSPAGQKLLPHSQREFWFEGYYRYEKVDSDANANGYKTSRGGMMIGLDEFFNDGLLSGLVFGYGNPRVYNSIGRIEADDYTFGAYSRLKIFSIYANTFIAYGHQNYELHQGLANTEYNGDSLYASLELFKPINLRNEISVSPLVAIDFQKSWSDRFNINVSGFPLSVGKSSIDQTVLRFGVNSNYKNLRTRLQYGYQAAGDLYGGSRTTIVGGNNSRVLTGVNLGRHVFNFGIGGDIKIANQVKLFTDYDLNIGKKTTSHTGQIGLVKNF